MGDVAVQETRQVQPLPSRPPAQRRNRNTRGQNRGARHNNISRPAEAVQDPMQTETTTSVEQPSLGRPSQQVRQRNAGGRRFGGELTRPSALHADAPAFTPGQPIPGRTAKTQARQRRGSKSTASDLPTRIHEDIDNLQYECAICTNNVQRNSLVWSCRTCWTVFHFNCAKKWAASSLAERQQQQRERPSSISDNDMKWRCPGCNLPQDSTPKAATCWCGKELGQKSIPGLPPFSCGQTCSRAHSAPKSCPHPCQELCHAGPCPPCPHTGPTQSCFCGRESATRKCVDTDYENGWSCEQACDDLMPCGVHNCTRACHEGLCGACNEEVAVRCYCGKSEQQLLCHEKGEEVESSIGAERWTGSFECDNICDRVYTCGKHRCEQPCHPQDAATPNCPRAPETVLNCPCGKTLISDLIDRPREDCENPIPHCSESCDKPLPCGHLCISICHTGDCMPCMKVTTITCRCGRATLPTVCHQGFEEQPQCTRICRAMLNCGRHQCDDRCCSGEKRAAERQSSKRRLQRSKPDVARAIDDDVEAEHICTMTCGRSLKCGNHDCQELCHRGPCGSCREAVFDDLSCNCGRTVLQSPLPCGTRPPPCRYDCERPKDCGHPQVAHNCHDDTESCPKCPFLTTKTCMCSKHQMKNQPCWFTDVRCGEICGQTLRTCGLHSCRKPCHRPGACEDAQSHCKQDCGKEKSCGHPDSAACHAPAACKEDRQCQHKIMITCTCQRIKKETACNSTKHTRGNLDKTLDCDDECARLERNRTLALALNIDPEVHKDDHIPYSAGTLNMFLSNSAWAQMQEKQFRLLAADDERRRLRFKPMPPTQRAFLHSLAEDFGFDSESMDPEPHRHVAIFKTPRFVMAPMKTLAECARIRHKQGLVSAVAAVVDNTKKAKVSNVVGEPYNAYLLTQVKFGLTVDDLRVVVKPILTNAFTSETVVDIEFLPNEDVVIIVKSSTAGTATPQSELGLDSKLTSCKSALVRQVNAHGSGELQLCRVDTSLNVVRRELDSTSSGGWSQVAAKAVAPRRAPVIEPVGKKSSFTVLGTTGLAARKKREKQSGNGKQKTRATEKQEEVAEDWEAAENEEEERERREAGTDGEPEALGHDGVTICAAAPITGTGTAENDITGQAESTTL